MIEVELPQDEKNTFEFFRRMETILDSINEPKLGDLGFESYRFSHFDSFQKHKLFRLNHYNDADNELVVKFFESKGIESNEIYTLISEEKMDLTNEQFHDFSKLIKGSYFWSMNTFENPIPQYLDGYVYILEGNISSDDYSSLRNHKVVRVVPHEGSFREACEKLEEFYEQAKTKK